MNIKNVVNLFNDLSYEIEKNYDENLDDRLSDLGLKFGFKGGDYIREDDLVGLSESELEILINDLNNLK
jgi:hypothetical protein